MVGVPYIDILSQHKLYLKVFKYFINVAPPYSYPCWACPQEYAPTQSVD